MSIRRLGLDTWRWSIIRRPFRFNHVSRHTRNGIDWVAGVLLWQITRYLPCTCN